MTKRGKQLDAEIAAALHGRSAHARKRKPKPRHEIQTDRLETLRAIMSDVLGDPAWRDTRPIPSSTW